MALLTRADRTTTRPSPRPARGRPANRLAAVHRRPDCRRDPRCRQSRGRCQTSGPARVPIATTLATGAVTVRLYDCDGEPGQAPTPEQHTGWSASYVRRGSFGCTCRGRRFELTPGAVLLGRPGDEYLCSHDHAAGGDQCLAVFVADAVIDEVARGRSAWSSGALPPLAGLAVIGERLHLPEGGHTELRLPELALGFATRVATTVGRPASERVRPSSRDRRRAVESALWIDAHHAEPLDLERLAARVHLSVFHFLRVFATVVGATPHQFLLRCRLRAAARMLAGSDRPVTVIALECGFADLSNFIRTFTAAAGASPTRFRALAVSRRARSRVAAPALPSPDR